MKNEEIIFAIQELDEKINSLSLSTKEILNFEEATTYLSMSSSHLYKLTSSKEIPHYKPSGKLIYFKKSELNQWILQNRQQTKSETTMNVIANFEAKRNERRN